MTQDNFKEIQNLINRYHDLAERSYSQGIYTFTGFLGLSEQDVFWREEQRLKYAGYSLNGGCDNADRVMIRFGNAEELGYEVPFPIVCIHIAPVMQKFADDLSHRDFLGALMNLGIERSTIGDIKVGVKQAYLFCQDSMAEYICDNLKQVRHTHVKCNMVERYEMSEEEKPETVTVQVQSLRVDAVIAKVYQLSRERSLELFRAGKVYVNGRLCESNSRILKPKETVNARGFGKFILGDDFRETRKGKLSVTAFVYR